MADGLGKTVFACETDDALFLCSNMDDGDALAGVVIVECDPHAPCVAVPPTLDGRPVRAIGEEAFSGRENLTGIVLPESVTHVGARAFASCTNLARIEFPRALAEIDASWLKRCYSLSELVLPGSAREVPAYFFGSWRLSSLSIGAGTQSIVLPHALCESVHTVRVEKGNPWLSTDGVCLYDRAGETLLECVVWNEEYAIAPGARIIAAGAFSYNSKLRRVVIPSTVSAVEEGTFSGSALESVDVPASVRTIGARAFFRCDRLERVRLHNGLEQVGEAAFEDCESLRALTIPATVAHLGQSLIANSGIAASGACAGFSIDAENPVLFVDEFGLQYRRDADGVTLVQALDRKIKACSVAQTAVRIGPLAFSGCRWLERVELPDGLRVIDNLAFSQCSGLALADLPESIERIGRRAFYGTALSHFRIPRGLVHIGGSAFIVYRTVKPNYAGLSHRVGCGLGGDERLARSTVPGDPFADDVSADVEPHRVTIDIEAGNPRFYVKNDMLCEWTDQARTQARVVLYLGSNGAADIPSEVTYIAPHAFEKFRYVKTLRFTQRMREVGAYGLALAAPPERIDIALDDGSQAHLLLAPNEYGYRRFMGMFGNYAVDLDACAYICDESLLHLGLSYGSCWRICERLTHPVLMDVKMKEDLLAYLGKYWREAADFFARNEHLKGLGHLVDFGFIDTENIDAVIQKAADASCVKAVSYLMDAKRHRLRAAAPDYDI